MHRDNWYKKVKVSGSEKQIGEKCSVDPVKIVRQRGYENLKLERIMSGGKLLFLISDIYAIEYGNDEPRTREEAELIGEFVQYVSDLIDVEDLFEPSERITLGFEMNDLINKLSNNGFGVFAAKEIRIIIGGNSAPANYPVLLIRIIRNRNVKTSE